MASSIPLLSQSASREGKEGAIALKESEDGDPERLNHDEEDDESLDYEFEDFGQSRQVIPWWQRGGLPRGLLIGVMLFVVLILGGGLGAGTTHVVNKSRKGKLLTPLDPDKVAVIIEKRNLPTLMTVLDTFLSRTPPEWPFQIWYGRQNEQALRTSKLLKPHLESGKLSMVLLPNEDEIYDGRTLSRFLTRPFFWEQLAPAKHIFFFQADTVICARSNYTVNDFLGLDVYETGYDWVGAPWWFLGYPFKPYGGNGGFCIRRREAMLNVTRQFGDEWNGENEDMWIAARLEKTSNQFPETNVSMKFSFEAPPGEAVNFDWVYQPYGVHIGNGGSWPMCQEPRDIHNEQINRLLAYCPEAKSVIPNICIPPSKK